MNRRLLTSTAAALALAIAVVGCGGDDEDESAGGESPSATATSGAGEGDAAAGKTVFTANCGSCHTLAGAGTSGNVGPDLDDLQPSFETVQQQVINGGGSMPAFGTDGTLTDQQIADVAAYVSTSAGG